MWETIATNWWASVCMDMLQKAYRSGRVRVWSGPSSTRIVVGGDGANWIHRGAEEFGNAVFQLDGFHLSRACGRGYGTEIGPAIYDAIRSGSESFASALMSSAVPAETATASRDREYVESNISHGVDWRNRVPNAPSDARSLGTMESNGDKLIANRMKKRGMSWTIRGANGTNGQDDPTESERRVGEVLSQAVGPRLGFVEGDVRSHATDLRAELGPATGPTLQHPR